jgi:hypothetical protein
MCERWHLCLCMCACVARGVCGRPRGLHGVHVALHHLGNRGGGGRVVGAPTLSACIHVQMRSANVYMFA